MLLFIMIFVSKIHSQEIKLHKLNIGLDFGIVGYSFHDKMLNYYKYNSTTFSPLNVHCYYLGENNIHFLHFNYNSTKLATSQASNLYKYNNINILDSRLNYEYYHKLKSIKHKFDFFIGSSLSLLGTNINQNYQSIYWQSVAQYSYDFSINYSINALLRYQRQKGCFIFKMGYSIVNYGSRPDDYFVKYGSQVDNQEWKWYLIGDYQNVPISLMYHYDISNRFSIRFEYLNEFRRYVTNDDFEFLKQSWFAGLSFKL